MVLLIWLLFQIGKLVRDLSLLRLLHLFFLRAMNIRVNVVLQDVLLMVLELVCFLLFMADKVLVRALC